MSEFQGFPSVGKGTAIPNLFFETVLPRMQTPDELLAFLWVARLTQEQKGEARCVSDEDIWAHAPARDSFEAMANGREGLRAGLRACLDKGALLAVRLSGKGVDQAAFFLNNPQSRRAISRARAGQLTIRPGAAVTPLRVDDRPDIFSLYEDHIGTITPLVAEKLMAAADTYPPDWIEDAFREAAEHNARNWRYVERILESWSMEGHGHETAPRSSFEEQKRRYLGGDLGNLARYR